MDWIRLASRWWTDPKILAAGQDAAVLFLEGLGYAGQHDTAGRVPAAAIALFPFPPTAKAKTLAARRLVEVELWAANGAGYQVTRWERWQEAVRLDTDRLEYGRAMGARKMALHRNVDLVKAIRVRDGDRCRYCGRKVDWSDRRGVAGGTYDHVEPFGENTLENIVVACRGCNSRKGARTPDEAGMDLRRPPARSDPNLIRDLSRRPNPDQTLEQSRSEQIREEHEQDLDLALPDSDRRVALEGGSGGKPDDSEISWQDHVASMVASRFSAVLSSDERHNYQALCVENKLFLDVWPPSFDQWRELGPYIVPEALMRARMRDVSAVQKPRAWLEELVREVSTGGEDPGKTGQESTEDLPGIGPEKGAIDGES
jgi:hypothetical protein